MKKNVHFAALFPWNLALITHNAPSSVNRSIDFSGQQAGRNSTTSGTGSVRVSSQGLSSSWSKLSPEKYRIVPASSPWVSVVVFDQTWHHLVLQEEKMFPMIPESIDREICTKMLRNVNGKFGGIFALTTLGYSVFGIPRLDNVFPGILELEASPAEAFRVHWNSFAHIHAKIVKNVQNMI